MALRTWDAGGGADTGWSNAANWDTGVPVDGDTFLIGNGFTATFDVDQSAFGNGISGTINGLLQVSTTPGAYVMKIKGDIGGTGTFRCGTSVAVPYPAGCTFTVQINGDFQLSGAAGLLVQFYCLQPTNPVIKLSANEAAGQTILSVDTDVTGDIWAAGNTIRIDDAGLSGNPDSEARVIAAGGIAADTITVTAGLTAAKVTRALVVLISRNVRITGSTGYAVEDLVNPVLRCEISGCSNGVLYGSGHTISGTVSGCSNGVKYGSGHTISGTVSGSTYGVYYGSGHTISGTVSGCSYGVNYGSGHTISGTVSGCTYGVLYGSGHRFLAATLNNTNDLYRVSCASGWKTVFAGATEHSGYNSGDRIAWHYVESRDHDGIADAFKAWCRGGIVTSVATPVPPGETISYQHAFESADYPCFRQEAVLVERGKTLSVIAKLRKSAAMGYLPRIQIVDPIADPLVDATESPLAEELMTDSVDTWETLSIKWENEAETAQSVIVRAIGKNGNGNLFETFECWVYILGTVTQVKAEGKVWEMDAVNTITFVLVDGAGDAVTGLGDGFDLFISKAGGAFAAGAGAKAEIGEGWYSYEATAGEADTLGPVSIYVEGTDTTRQNFEYVVQQRTVSAIGFTYTVTNSATGLPIEGVQVWISTDASRQQVVWYGTTDAFGVARDDEDNLPFLDPGTYYFWRQKGSYTFDDPDTEVVS